MPTNSDTNKLFENDEPKDNREKWNEMTERAKKCPGILELDRWIEDSLEELENEFCGFSTQNSMRRKFGR